MFRFPSAETPPATAGRLPRLTRRRAIRLFAGTTGRLRARSGLLADDSGAATAEYAIATMAAVAFAGLLVVIMRSDEVRGILTDLVRRALTFE
jgi:Flp pilus assembly pilin Flp